MSHLTEVNIDKIQNLYAFLKDQGEEEQKEKVLDLYEKLIHEELIIGFAGHFSAGKSTLINTLLENDLLPSSPIPTSANIVRLRTGDPYTLVHFQDGTVVQYDEDIDLETIKALCKDGEKITGLEISQPGQSLPSHVSIVDTPGVDSTNDADRLITESSLHLMDYMYYVMDYNHVQSEVNLMFLLEMQRRKTPFSVVINQVDKHVERELSFEAYQKSVRNAFEKWGIHPEEVYFTSLRDYSLPFNQLPSLKENFHSLFSTFQLEKHAETQLEWMAEEAVMNYSDHVEDEMAELREEKEGWEKKIDQSPFHVTELENQQILHEKAEADFQERVSQFIFNAYLMPSALREYAEAYLESVQPDFKVGFLFTQKKTEEERLAREQAFYTKLRESVEKNLSWPLRERMIQLMEHYSVSDEKLLEKVQKETFQYPRERLYALVERGASVTGAYVLRYTDDLSKDIQKETRRFIQEWKQLFLQSIAANQQQMVENHKEVFEAAEKKQELDNQLEVLNEKINEYRSNLEEYLKRENSKENTIWIKDAWEKRKEKVVCRSADEIPSLNSVVEEEELDSRPDSSQGSGSSIEQALQRADETLKNIQSLEGTKRLYSQLKKKRNRLDGRHFTIALFGAFSAGKSSFANALLGDLVLPVSPNPTTATINKISPPTDERPDRTIDAYIKTESEMLEDLSSILGDLNLSAPTLEDVHAKTKKLQEKDWQLLGHKQHSFLRAFIDGYPSMKLNLGKRIDVSWEDFSLYVSKEEKSCFIESMELFYDCPWTNAGVTLVDTPGADSVNARHTDVSFEYIKDSDAVLFVTYYNHPFSHADQTFLKQLGRVKDSFSLDKMFFLVNAADLASSDEERKQVESYVRGQLNEFQIRHPKLFSLSSLQALDEKMDGTDLESGMQPFEESFRSFLHEDLAQMMIHAIDEDIKSIRQVLENFIAASQLSEQERREEIEKSKQEQHHISENLEKSFDQGTEGAIHNKADKQIHFVHERMMLNFNDLFKRHFNPATIQNQGDTKEALKVAQKELLDELSFEMLQEVKAVCVRMERFLDQLVSQTKERIESDLYKIRPTLQLSRIEEGTYPLPILSGKVNIGEKEKASLLKLFRNPKAFFERNEKEEMRDSMSAIISPELKAELETLESLIIEHYTKLWQRRYAECMNIWREDASDHFTQLQSHLERPENTQDLEEILSRIPKF
ncbi:dynamin family protein [Halobacillus sp. Nhm2S1]|uniref:dynamin family protein n=1 Tax=Halobacillus sp. Nhm2S1 TaxID=2866716 RepID=UPI001C733961|nr:dynamin family protein [Halobacillus sp. Nhm2S1]MBX0356302.1 dynamin family protein [Halobacillus sp. Nhm2S1]